MIGFPVPVYIAPLALGLHISEVDFKGNWLSSIPTLLDRCGMSVTRARSIKKSAEAEKLFHQREDMPIAWYEQGWTHLSDGEYRILGYPNVWQEFSAVHHIRVMVWCQEDAADANYFCLIDSGQIIRTIESDNEKYHNSGKPLPQERNPHGWDPVEIADLVEMLGARSTLYDHDEPSTAYEVKPEPLKKS